METKSPTVAGQVLISEREAAARLGVSPRLLWSLRASG